MRRDVAHAGPTSNPTASAPTSSTERARASALASTGVSSGEQAGLALALLVTGACCLLFARRAGSRKH